MFDPPIITQFSTRLSPSVIILPLPPIITPLSTWLIELFLPPIIDDWLELTIVEPDEDVILLIVAPVIPHFVDVIIDSEWL